MRFLCCLPVQRRKANAGDRSEKGKDNNNPETSKKKSRPNSEELNTWGEILINET
jgi:hypothetical protein